MLNRQISGMSSRLSCSLWIMVLERGVSVLASSSSSEGNSPFLELVSSSSINSGADGSGGGGGATWDRGGIADGSIVLGTGM